MFRFALAIFIGAVYVEGNAVNSVLSETMWKNHLLRKVSDEKIVGGNEVTPNSIPYQVSLRYVTLGFHFCAGAILSEKFVLTAAHCCQEQTALGVKVIAGEHSLAMTDGTEQEVSLSAIYIHPDYSSSTMSNDVCLLELAEPLIFNRYVSAIDLPSPMQSFWGEKAIVAGWGGIHTGGWHPDGLHAVEVPIVSDEACRVVYGEDAIDDSMICAGKEGKDACSGDDGAALNCGGIHCGILTYTIGCGELGHPSIYAATSHVMDFINEHLKKH